MRLDSWVFADALLVGLNVWHIIIGLSILHPVDSPLKKPWVKAVANVCNKCQTPLLCWAFLGALAFIAFMSGYQCLTEQDRPVSMLARAIIGMYTALTAVIFMKLTGSFRRLGVDRVLEIEHELENHDVLSFKPPPVSIFKALLAPLNMLIPTDTTGLENVPTDKPSLYVMNHSLCGIDMAPFVYTLYHAKGVYVRGLADHFHWMGPHGPLLRRFGAVDGNRDNVDLLMRAKQDVLVYPGGGHEVLKHSSIPKYSLLWKERLGFARMAIKHGYQIVPCASVGVEDMLDIVADIPTGYKKMTIPVTTMSPRKIQKMYFWFGEPISTTEFKRDYLKTEYAREVRDRTKAAIESGIQHLQRKQREDPERFLVHRARKVLSFNSETSLSSLDKKPHEAETDKEACEGSNKPKEE